MEEMQERAFKGVWIPKEIWLNPHLSLQEKAVLVEIDSFCSHYESCYASNEHFAKFIQVGERRIQKILKSLEDKGFIEREIIYKKGTKEIEKRFLRVREGWRTKVHRGSEQKFVRGSEQKFADNNTYKNNTNNSILSDSSSDHVSKIIAYLNEKAGTSYRPSTSKTKKLIHARMVEGFTLEDFKQVIDTKCSEWQGTNMAKYLRPETLFGTKFEGYLNEKPQEQKPADSWEEALRELDSK
jgi:uncharacterized phage protein (TIGR02220 family)